MFCNMNAISMNILLYSRVSTEDQVLDPQWLELRDRAAREGWTVAGEFSDVLSGGRAARPGIDALRARCLLGGIEAVVVVKLDRLGRSMLNVVRLVEELAAAGTAIICTSQGIDTRAASPCGKLIYQLMAAFAEFEKSLIVERTVAGLRSARALGRVGGRPSEALKGCADVAGTVAAWKESGRVGGLRALARLLGGCSVSTAHRLANAAVPAAIPAMEV